MKKFLIPTLLFLSIAVSGQTINKKVALAKGQQMEQINQSTMNLTQEMMGQVMEIKIETTLSNILEVKDATSTNYSISKTMKRMVLNMSGMQEMKFDSDKKEDMDGQIGEKVKDKIGIPVEFIVNKEGIVTSVKETSSKEEMAGVAGMMGSMFGQYKEDSEGATFGAIANIPSKGIKVGDTWSDSSSDSKHKSYTTYTLKEIKGNDGLVTLSQSSNMNAEIEQQGMTLEIDMRGTTIGEYTFDVQTGVLRTRKSTSKATGTMSVMGQSVPMSIDAVITSTFTPK